MSFLTATPSLGGFHTSALNVLAWQHIPKWHFCLVSLQVQHQVGIHLFVHLPLSDNRDLSLFAPRAAHVSASPLPQGLGDLCPPLHDRHYPVMPFLYSELTYNSYFLLQVLTPPNPSVVLLHASSKAYSTPIHVSQCPLSSQPDSCQQSACPLLSQGVFHSAGVPGWVSRPFSLCSCRTLDMHLRY